MTAFAIDYRRDRFTVASDSLGYVPDRLDAKPLGFVPKVIHLPHIRAVVFGRGQAWITVQAAAQLMLSAQVLTVEDAAAALPGILRALTKQYADIIGIKTPVADLCVLEITLAGWSESEQRMRFYQWGSYENYETRMGTDGRYVGSWAWPLLPAHYIPRDLASAPLESRLIGLIKAIDAYFVDEPETNHGQRVGGEIAVTEVTPHGISHRIVHRFENYDQVRHAAAAVMARLERGEIDGHKAVRDGLTTAADAVHSETGEPLRAANAAPVPIPSRQQRRAEERRAAKARRAA